MASIRRRTRQLVRRLGYDIIRFDSQEPGHDPFLDMTRLLSRVARPMVLDVGANVGQSIAQFREAFPRAVIHSFEPSPTTYAELKRRNQDVADVNLWNSGVGATTGSLSFLVNSDPYMSSFLAPGPTAWGQVVQTPVVPVITLDDFTAREAIERVHVLKSDTQGYDLEVLKGCKKLFAEKRVDLVYYEAIVSNMYDSLPPFYDVFRFLAEGGFSLVSLYDQHYQNGMLSWTDVLFARTELDQREGVTVAAQPAVMSG